MSAGPRRSSSSRGPLFHLPLELLVRDLGVRPKPEGVILGRFETPRYAIDALPPMAYALSASLSLIRHCEGGSRHALGSLLAFGNPTPEQPAGKRSGVRMRRGQRILLSGLPDAEREARDVASLYGGGTTVYLGRDATKERFLAEAGGYRSLLLATHGILDEREPMHSGLVFAPRPGEEDGSLLETHEIFNIRLAADLVTLSACEVGLGRIRDGEGLIGMGQAFLYAGASSLVVSLWSVYDPSTAQLITGFHGHVRDEILEEGARFGRASSRRSGRGNRFRRGAFSPTPIRSSGPRLSSFAVPDRYSAWRVSGPLTDGDLQKRLRSVVTNALSAFLDTISGGNTLASTRGRSSATGLPS